MTNRVAIRFHNLMYAIFRLMCHHRSCHINELIIAHHNLMCNAIFPYAVVACFSAPFPNWRLSDREHRPASIANLDGLAALSCVPAVRHIPGVCDFRKIPLEATGEHGHGV